jgi:GT2 family glycosyltransferase
VKELPNTTNCDRAAQKPTLFPERFRRAASLRIRHFFKRALPRPLIHALRELQGRILTRDYPRHTQFEQSMEDAQATAFLSIIVPVHDAPTVTRRCLGSLEKYAPRAEVIIVDDGSSLAETRSIIAAFSSRNGWKSVHHEKPFGHSVACGTGASLATRPYLCLLNSDTVVTPWCWRLVTEVFEHDLRIAVAGPSTSYCGTIQRLPVAAYFSPYWNDNQICDFAKRLVDESSYPIVEDLTWVSGFAFFIRRSLWEQLSGFDRYIPDYGNEFELCKRVSEKGYRTVWVRNSYIHHYGQQSYREAIGEDAIRARNEAAKKYIKQKGRSATWS